IRQVNLGQYLNDGAAVVPLQSLDPIYVNFSVPQQEVSELKIGREVRVALEAGTAAPSEFTGKITAVDSIVDQATRNVMVQATLANPNGALRPGMFVKAHVLLDNAAPITVIPASAISFAPYGG